jgi:hypothetical protein
MCGAEDRGRRDFVAGRFSRGADILWAEDMERITGPRDFRYEDGLWGRLYILTYFASVVLRDIDQYPELI